MFMQDAATNKNANKAGTINFFIKDLQILDFWVKPENDNFHLSQGKRIINVFSIKLAFRHGFLVQNRAIMRYTLIVAK